MGLSLVNGRFAAESRHGPSKPGTAIGSVLLLRFDVVQRARLVEKGLRWAVEAEDREPALAGNYLDPIAAAFRFVRTEDHAHRTVCVDFWIDVAAHRREGLAILQLGSAQRVVNDHGPKVFRRNVREHVQLVPDARARQRDRANHGLRRRRMLECVRAELEFLDGGNAQGQVRRNPQVVST